MTSQKLPFFYYWGRLRERLLGQTPHDRFGDGTSMGIGRREVIRRLSGLSRMAELSIDDPKADSLMRARNGGQMHQLWHVMGHPKLLSPRSLDALHSFVVAAGIRDCMTLGQVAELIGSGELRRDRRRLPPRPLNVAEQLGL